uniref:Synaptobrevin, longin-like domain protein n=1 Tax=Tanacetum cinerariifolium TaxID=118510 RepID=A0A6L2MMB4_TANCI|nr:hypothetical protein [Tanacetum cinerariifolium]
MVVSLAGKTIQDAEMFEQLVDHRHLFQTPDVRVPPSDRTSASSVAFTDSSILDDAEDLVCLPNEEIFAGLAQMGYEKPSTKLNFYKAFFSSQWKFLIHTLLQSLSAKRTFWNEFSTAMASAETVAEDVANDAISSPPSHDIPSTSQDHSSPPQQPQSSPQAPPQGVEFLTHFQQVLDICSALTCHVKNLEHDKAAQKLEIIKLKARVKRLERANKVKSSKLRRLRKVGASKRIESSDDIEDVFNQGRMIDDLDKDEGIELVVDQDDSEVQEVVKVVTTGKLIKDVVTAASQVSADSATIFAAKLSIPAAAPTVVAAYIRRRKGVIIKDPEEELSSKTPVETPKLKDKGKGILIETPKPIKKKDQIELDAEYARKLHEEINKDHEEINKDIDWDAAIDNAKQKSKNPQYIKRYQVIKKRPQTERMSYDEICLIFQARFDANMRFLFKSREEMEEEDQEVVKVLSW